MTGRRPTNSGDEAELDQILGLCLAQQLCVALGRQNTHFLGFLVRKGLEAESFLAHTATNQALQPDEGATTDEEDVGGVDRGEFLVGMLTAALGRNVGYGTFQNLEQRLLDAFAGDIAGDRRILILAPDFIDLININNAGLCPGHIAVCGLEQLEDDVFDVLADVAGLGQRGCIDDGEGHVQHFGQRVSQQGFAAPGGPDEENVGLGKLDIIAARPVHLDALVMVVDGYRQLLLGLILADDVLIEKALDLLRFWQMRGCGAGLRLPPIVFQDGVADRNALITYVRPRIVTR